MKKTFCDACNYEIVDSRVYAFDPLKHIAGHIDGTGGGFVDRNFNPVSGVSEHFDLCLSCYNAINFEAYKVFKVIKDLGLVQSAIKATESPSVAAAEGGS